MHRFRNILLALHSDRDATGIVDRAAKLALRNDGTLTIARTLPAMPRELQRLTVPIDPECLVQIATEEHLTQLELLAAPWQDRIRVETKVLWGTPFLEIIREVLRGQHDLLMATAAETRDLSDVFFGSTSMHLMRKCPCPVWVLAGDKESDRYHRVMAAVDAIASDDEHRALNLRIMELATSLARMEGSHLHVVHAWRPWTSSYLLPEVVYARGFLDDAVAESEGEHRRALDDLLAVSSKQGVQVDHELLYGDAAEAIPTAAARNAVDVIVMGTVCRTGVAGLLMGNTAEVVLRRVQCSVLTVKPEGFATPVTLPGDAVAAAGVNRSGIA